MQTVKSRLLHSKGFVLFFFSCFFTIITNLLTNRVLSDLLGAAGKSVRELTQPILWLGCLYVIVPAVLMACGMNIQFPFIERFMVKLTNDISNRILRMSYAEYARKTKDAQLSQLVNDTERFQEQYFAALKGVIETGGTCAVGILLISFLKPSLCWGVAVYLGSVLLVGRFFRRRIIEINKSVSECSEDFTSNIANTFMGLEIIRMNHAEAAFLEASNKEINKLEGKKAQYTYFNQVQTAISGQMGTVATVLTLLFVSWQMAVQEIGLGEATFLVLILNMITQNMIRFLGQYNILSAAKKLIESPEDGGYRPQREATQEEAGTECFALNSGIRVENLSYGFGERRIFNQSSFFLKKGGKFLIRGSSGAGKTTFLNLLSGVYNDYDGAVFYDDAELRQISQESLNQHVAIIFQDVFLFEDTVRNNICLYEDYSDTEIERVIHAAGLDEVVKKLPSGLDTVLTGNGKDLSGGERQRISIARAIMKKADLLLADEITACLPEDMALQIEETILNLDMTVLMVSHRTFLDEEENYNGILHVGPQGIQFDSFFDDDRISGSEV